MNSKEKQQFSLEEVNAAMDLAQKKAAAQEALNLCRIIWTEAMNTKESFGVDPQSLDEFISIADGTIIDPRATYDAPDSFLNDSDCPVFVRGDFSIIEGKAKSRKTFLSSLLIALLLPKEDREDAKRFTTPTKPNKVLWIDTEQGAARTARTIDRLKAKGADTSKVIHSSMRELGAVGRFKTFTYLVALYRPDFILLDGVADLMNNINDIPEAAMIRQLLLTVSANYGCHISAVLHTNEKGDDSTARGQVGSELTRKCSTILHLDAEGDYTKVTYTRTRDKKPEPFVFRIDEVDYNEGREKIAIPNLADLENLPKPRTNSELESFEYLRDLCKGKQSGLQRKDLINALLKKGLATSARTAERRIDDAVKLDYLERNNSYYYPKN